MRSSANAANVEIGANKARIRFHNRSHHVVNAASHLFGHVLPASFGDLSDFIDELIPAVLHLLGELHEGGIGFRKLQLRRLRVELLVRAAFGLCAVRGEP